MRLVFLGTGAGVPSRHRNVAGLLVEFPERGRAWLVDAGEGTQLQLMKTTLSAHRIERIFITHLHGDHLFGLPGVLSSRSFQDGVGPLDLYGPPGIAEYAKPLFAIPTHSFLFNPGIIDPRPFMDMLALEESEYELIRHPQRGLCLFRCGNERFNLVVSAPTHKADLFGTEGGQ